MTRAKYFGGALLLLAGAMIICSFSGCPAVKKRYSLDNSSRLYLTGTSNVNSFTCDCEDRFYHQILYAECVDNHAIFNSTGLCINTANFNCHNGRIDADMQKALKADQYPQIKMTLIDTWQDGKCLQGGCNDWFDVQAKVNLTITNVTKTLVIYAKARQLDPNRVRLVGQKGVLMSDFGITPPEVMFGMIKVNDAITFNFDLLVVLEP